MLSGKFIFVLSRHTLALPSLLSLFTNAKFSNDSLASGFGCKDSLLLKNGVIREYIFFFPPSEMCL